MDCGQPTSVCRFSYKACRLSSRVGGEGRGSHTKCRGGEVRRTSIGVKILGSGTAWGVQRKHNT